jgi:D-aminoacyl-tRNA deacylase
LKRERTTTGGEQILTLYNPDSKKDRSMKLIVASTQDTAGMNIAQKIIEQYKLQKTNQTYHELPIYQQTIEDTEIKLVTIRTETIQAQNITNDFTPELIIFVSRHSSQSGIPTLSVHTPGNLTSQAEKGGLPKQISIAPATAMKEALKEMARQVKQKQLDYKVSYECTHHGPSLNVPTMFAELGSSPTQWKDMQAAEAVAHAAMTAAKTRVIHPTVIGIGGPHYSEKFTKIAFTTPMAFGHMIPKRVIPQIDTSMIEQCIVRTVEKVETTILDWKGIKGEDKQNLLKTIAQTSLRIEKV